MAFRGTKKRKLWVWLVVARHTRVVLASLIALGSRGRKTAKRRLALDPAEPLDVGTYVAHIGPEPSRLAPTGA